VIEEQLPFSVTHAGCRTVHDHPRNLADWQLEALAERGGVLGMMAIAFAVDPEAPTMRRWLDHFDHAVAVMGIAHVGLGADFVDQTTQGRHAKTAALTKKRLTVDAFTGPDRPRTSDECRLMQPMGARGDTRRSGPTIAPN
jgi:microsomal dipeptidase-like Zn-dependent dipeptidase